MKKSTQYSVFTMICATSLLFAYATVTIAQIDEARKTNWNNASALFPRIESAASAKNRDEIYKLTDEFRLNLDYVQSKLERVGERLHDKDKNWSWSSKKSYAVDRVRRTKVAAGVLGSKAKEVNSNFDSEFNTLKSEWKELIEGMNELWREYLTHGRELNDIVKAFREDCRECMP